MISRVFYSLPFLRHLLTLVQFYVAPERIAMMTPYRAMCAYITAKLKAAGHFAHLVGSMDRSREGIVDYQHESEIRHDARFFVPDEPTIHPNGIAVGTVDGFQGNEKDLTIVVLTAAANSGLGFVANRERLCVALTRHRQSLIVVEIDPQRWSSPPDPLGGHRLGWPAGSESSLT